MIPINDDVSRAKLPWMTFLMIGICSAVFVLQMTADDGGCDIVDSYGVVPRRVVSALKGTDYWHCYVGHGRTRNALDPFEVEPVQTSPWLTLFTSVFLHGSIGHLFWNMMFLYALGRSVEDRIGHISFGLMFAATGISASMTSVFADMARTTPGLGASGAVAGVMGTYILLLPRARVLTIIPLVFLYPTFYIPAPLVLGLWFVLQLYYGIAELSGSITSNVGWWAHIGGFVAGYGLVFAGGRLRSG